MATPGETPKAAPVAKPPEAGKAAPKEAPRPAAVDAAKVATIEADRAKEKAAKKPELQKRLSDLKGQLLLAETDDLLQGETFTYQNDYQTFDVDFKAKLVPALHAKSSALDQKAIDDRVAVRLDYLKTNIRLQTLDANAASLIPPNTITIVIGAGGEPTVTFKGDAEKEKEAAKQSADAAASPEAAKKFEEFRNGGYGKFTDMILRTFTGKNEGESDADFNTRVDAKLKEAYEGKGLLGMMLYFAGAIAAGTMPFYDKLKGTEIGKGLDGLLHKALSAMGLDSWETSDVKSDAFDAMMKKTDAPQKGNFVLKEKVKIPADVTVTVMQFSPGEDMPRPDKPGESYKKGEKYDKDKNDGKEIVLPGGVELPAGTVLAGAIKVSKKEEEKKAA